MCVSDSLGVFLTLNSPNTNIESPRCTPQEDLLGFCFMQNINSCSLLIGVFSGLLLLSTGGATFFFRCSKLLHGFGLAVVMHLFCLALASSHTCCSIIFVFFLGSCPVMNFNWYPFISIDWKVSLAKSSDIVFFEIFECAMFLCHPHISVSFSKLVVIAWLSCSKVEAVVIDDVTDVTISSVSFIPPVLIRNRLNTSLPVCLVFAVPRVCVDVSTSLGF